MNLPPSFTCLPPAPRPSQDLFSGIRWEEGCLMSQMVWPGLLTPENSSWARQMLKLLLRTQQEMVPAGPSVYQALAAWTRWQWRGWCERPGTWKRWYVFFPVSPVENGALDHEGIVVIWLGVSPRSVFLAFFWRGQTCGAMSGWAALTPVGVGQSAAETSSLKQFCFQVK